VESGKWKVEDISMSSSIVADKSFAFAISVVRLYKCLSEAKEFVLSKQLLRSGTSIGANVSEALQGQSKRDFLMKMNIALKEASETKYWLRLLSATEYLSNQEYHVIFNDCVELEKMLTSIVKTTYERVKK
jgi:four helix bundle protein